jgi:hypothetical protein
MKLFLSALAALALVAVARPALACGDMKTTTAEAAPAKQQKGAAKQAVAKNEKKTHAAPKGSTQQKPATSSN